MEKSTLVGVAVRGLLGYNANNNFILACIFIYPGMTHKKFERGVKVAIYISVAEPSLNKDGGHYILPAVRTNPAEGQGPGVAPVPGLLLMLRSPLLNPQHHCGANST